MKPVAIVCVLFFLAGATGLPDMIQGDGIEKFAGIAYCGCIVLGILGLAGAFMQWQQVTRLSLLWSIGIPAIVYATHEMTVAYPTPIVRFPITFGSTYSNGNFTKIGFDVVPAILFIAVWSASAKASKQFEVESDTASNETND